ncbi:Up-regulated during septation-domain-containing protein [Mycena maculata]|uniref:Up-regulated during septation-domain-containing protein n=1 Tax=Mycena maculata TaxID=230809 RepID=A0AAD7JSU5_9AGAR|nr:Up-regulated during septation-domain-containing protein [Mycena maculata]
MNGFGGGVRRFLASATGTTSPPPSEPLPLKPGAPTWPPQSPTTSPTTSPLSLRKDKQELPEAPRSPARVQKPLSNGSPKSLVNGSPQPSSPRQLPSSLSRVPPPPTRLSTSRTATQPPLNTRDELLISLLASEAVVDSRDFEILSSEEVDDLKKEQQVLMSRQGAMTKKLTLETKIRDAALSLSRVNASHKKVSKQSEEQLEAANKRVEAAELELHRVTDRVNEIHKRLLEHRAGVLSFSVRSMERKMAPGEGNTDSGYNTPSGTQRSPTGSSVSGNTSQAAAARFDGAHFFAGHADTVVPTGKGTPPPAVLAIEEKLARATEALAASSEKQAELARELAAARAEKDAIEAAREEEMRSAQDTIAALERELPRLEGMSDEMQTLEREKAAWAEERAAMIREREEERAAWDRDKNMAEDERLDDLARLQDETERLRGEDAIELQRVQTELEDGASALRALVKAHGIPMFSRDPTLPALVSALGSHLLGISTKVEIHAAAQAEWQTLRRKLEDDIRAGLDKREALSREVEDARREREEARKEIRAIELRVKTDNLRSLSPLPSPKMELTGDAKQLAAILQPLWAILPSPEARASKFGQNQRFRAGSGATSPTQPPSPNPVSLSDLDVRSLKALYDPRTPSSPTPGATAPFSLDAFVARVQALIADDRALIERLVRFAQAHDLLKKNAERAQKLAAEGSGALETYQKQVRTLEERNMDLAGKVSSLQDEVATLQGAIERISGEKRDVEVRAAEQAVTCSQLTEANNALSAKTLALAAEAASAPEAVRRQLEAQLAEVRGALDNAQAEVDAMRMSEQGQRMALLDELNTLQEENGKLRDQLRTKR